LIGAKGDEDFAELKRLYRDTVKKYHPDALRSRGASEKEICLATERMKKINAAWSRIKAACS
jgi:DnaJ like chaperone protein